MKILLKLAAPAFLCLLMVAPMSAGCGSSSTPEHIESIDTNTDPASFLSMLEALSAPEREEYIAQHKAEYDSVMARATAEERARIEQVRSGAE